ncbi:hypothetical protein ES288_A10G101000v1 [Gossypium darwinii]|uniref:Uncharacterized protein n=1 Tax=Gossypium darwinii TaxID=34276 RepID=A0A5D2EXU4_GOSDA|nr:hypothetical protein ES288_A10G101000v1 [Gossypium darwinii]
MNSEKTMNNDIPSLTFQAHRCMKKIENPIMTSLFSYHYPPSNSVVCCQLLPLLEVTVELTSYFHGGPIVARTWIYLIRVAFQ